MNAYDIIRRPVITEQSMEAVADKKYVFMVDVNANKTQIKEAVELAFGVKVDGKAVVVTPAVDTVVVKSARNIPGVLTTTATILSVYDLLNAKYLVLDQRALATIEEVFA